MALAIVDVVTIGAPSERQRLNDSGSTVSASTQLDNGRRYAILNRSTTTDILVEVDGSSVSSVPAASAIPIAAKGAISWQVVGGVSDYVGVVAEDGSSDYDCILIPVD